MQRHELRRALEALGTVLSDRGLAYRIVVAGGAALLLREGLERATQDVDVVAVSRSEEALRPRHMLPTELIAAAEDVARLYNLESDWLNAGALGILADRLPQGYQDRLRTERFGNLTVSVLARQDLIRLKLYAATDEGPGSVHLNDLVRMSPTADEVHLAVTWVRSRYADGPIPELDSVLGFLPGG